MPASAGHRGAPPRPSPGGRAPAGAAPASFARVPARAAELDLSCRALRVLMLLGLYADPAGFCWPGQATLARRLRTTRVHVNEALKELAAAGLVTVTRGQRGCLYRVLFAAADVPETETSGNPDVPENEALMYPKRVHKLDQNYNLKEARQLWRRPDVPGSGTSAEPARLEAEQRYQTWRARADGELEATLAAMVSVFQLEDRERFWTWSRAHPAEYWALLQDLSVYLNAPPIERAGPREQLRLRLFQIIKGGS